MDQEPERPSAPSGATDLELLQQFEPIVLYTRGEQFYPTDVQHYINQCSLWERTPKGRDVMLVKQGDLNQQSLIEDRPAAFGTIRYMRFIETLDLVDVAQVLADHALQRLNHPTHFHAGIGRLARGGYLPRLVDGLFSLSFLLRGRVSAATAAAAEVDYKEIFKDDQKYTYYGRVVRQSGWVVLQYWYFFCFNNWRSGFHGVNDHESDWEMANIYLYEDNGRLIPEWVAYASHDFKGDDLRRRWDDERELRIVEGHPVIYAGAGSHASYFRRGEYQAEVYLALPSLLAGLLRLWNKLWSDTLGQPPAGSFHIPFVDFARGDGVGIGPTRHRAWTPALIDENTPWVSQYRGLWGLFARDPISGENAPAGPMYNRDGSPRAAWYDPLGFAGLDTVPPPPEGLTRLQQNLDMVMQRQKKLEQLIPEKADELQELGAKVKGMECKPHLAKQHGILEKDLNSLSANVRALRREYSENAVLYQGLLHNLENLKAGVKTDPRDHIRHLAVPDDPSTKLRFDRAAESWAAVSMSLLLFIVAALIVFQPKYSWTGLAIILLLFFVTDSVLRGAFTDTVAKITLVLAMIAAVILFLHFWRWIIVGALVAMGISLMVQRLRELTS